MSSQFHDPVAPEPPVMPGEDRASVLLRRLMIRCPETGLPADTGFELSEIPALAAQPQILVDCLECGQDHPWQLEDAFLS